MWRIRNKFRKIMEVARGFWRYNVMSKWQTLLPREIIINLTYECNSHCTMCNIWRIHPKGEMGVKEWEKVIEDDFFSEVRSLTISGGEPTEHPEFNEIGELIIKRLPKLKYLSMVSNGFKTEVVVGKVKKLAELCKKNKIGFGISISLDGLKKGHQEIRRIEDGFAKTWGTILELKKLQKIIDFNVSVGTVVLRQNLNDIEEIDSFLTKNKVDHDFQIVGFHKTFVNNLETKDKINFREEDKEMLGKVLKKLINRGGIRSYYWADLLAMYMEKKPRTTPCPFLIDQAVIDGMGNVYYCLSIRPIGNFLKEKRSIAEIYLDPKNIEFRKNLPKKSCANCNSGCNVKSALADDFKKLAWYKMTGKLWRW